MIEHATTGGTCVNVGCIPSKTLLADSVRFRQAGAPSLADATGRKRGLVEDLRQTLGRNEAQIASCRRVGADAGDG